MDSLAILQDVIEYVDEHITEELTPSHLAARAGFSVWHFCRIFQWGTGYSTMDYVRRRRLAFAAYELTSGERILDISVKYAFETQSGFSKAFRRQFGCSPGTYRKHAYSNPPKQPNLSKLTNYAIGGIILEPKFITLPSLKIVGFALRTTSSNGENSTAIPNFWKTYMIDGRMEKLHAESFVKKHDEYGVCFPEDPQTGEFDYLIGVEPSEDAIITDDYQARELPPATYAVFSTPPSTADRFVATIQGTWNYIFNEWFPSVDYEYAPECADFERYDDRCMTDDGKVCMIYIPVVRKHH